MLIGGGAAVLATNPRVAFAAQGVELARTFPALPTVTRITIGSKADMEGFFAAFNKVVSA